jgi:hypothetical protein
MITIQTPTCATMTRLVLSRPTKPLSQVPRRSSQTNDTRTQPTGFDRAIAIQNSRRSSKPYLRDYRDPQDHFIHPRHFSDPEIPPPPRNLVVPQCATAIDTDQVCTVMPADLGSILTAAAPTDPPSPCEPVPFDRER